MLKNLFKWSYFIYALLYVALPAYAVFNILGKPVIGTDDSNIYLQYTRNFTSGYGIVYNPGGEHVEGFSSILYFLICSFFNLFTDTPEIYILLFNGIIALISCILVLHTIKIICDQFNVTDLNIHLLYGAYLFWMFINPAFFGWTIITLMDSGIYVFLLVLSYTYFIRLALKEDLGKKDTRTISILLFLMIIGRPEGIAWAMVFVCLYFVHHYRLRREWKASIKALIMPVLVLLGTILILTCFRLWYFGYPLPNTYYTKVSASFSATLNDGLHYFQEFIRIYNSVILFFTIIMILWLMYLYFKKSALVSLHFVSFITIAFILVGIALPVLEGGDHFHAFRFFQPVYPFLIMPFILLLIMLGHAGSFSRLLIRVVPVCLILFFLSKANWNNFYRNNNTFQAPEDVSMCIKMEFNIAAYTRENGKRLNDFFREELPVIGFGAAGGIALGYDGIVYDMLGLNLPKLAHADKIKEGPKAHQSFNKKVFYELAPDVLMPTAELSSIPVSLVSVAAYYCDQGSWDNLIYKNIFNDEEFKQKYTLALATNANNPGYVCYGYFNNNYLKELTAKQNFKFQIHK
jgi:arabinofuranosyltransferase